MITLKVRLTFTESILGTSPSNEDIYTDFIGSKAPEPKTIKDEVEALGVDGAAEKAATIFPRNEAGDPFLYDYQVKGFFKDACGGLRDVKGTESSKIKAYKKKIDRLVFPGPRQIPFEGYDGIRWLQRPLRAQTAQGERVSLAMSEEIPAGASVTFEILILQDDLRDAVVEWLNYGRLSGIGQWRNSGRGRFRYEILAEE